MNLDLSDVDQYTIFMDLPQKIIDKRKNNFDQCDERFEELKRKIFNGDELMTCTFIMFFTNVFNDPECFVNKYADFFLHQIVDANLVRYVDFGFRGFSYCFSTENLNFYTINRFALSFRQGILDGFKQKFKNHKQYADYLLFMFYIIMVYSYAFERNSMIMDSTTKYFAIQFIALRRNKIISKDDYNLVLREIFYISKMMYQTVKNFEKHNS